MRGLLLISTLVFILLLILILIPAPAEQSPVPAPEPIRCAPCTAEKLSACPAAPSGCRELMREPGCGCCMTCALPEGALCGVYTAHCGTGLRCTPRADDPHPLHSLTRGQAVCTVDHAAQGASPLSSAESPSPVDQHEAKKLPYVMLNHNRLLTEEAGEHAFSLHHLLGLDKAGDPEAHESIKAKVNAIRKKLVELGPCHTELHSALDTIAASQQALGEKFTTFYLPNCDKHGFYKPKQCETSLVGQPARCWCVSAWNGKRLAGSGDVPEDALCHQEITH
ncbi:insulin-like growth factor-binding protein 1b isoform X1 [Pangasianodon hypophthalmus]|uniref:insulin-like growth factor-binding protein 1b isoform X1 n=1 Tax=Pangasianodon hypophthalmus TaxID=310915 RepID=UPI000F007B8E|nr:insulin-like growth factor-binding protein 1b isoform X1 [Pangasianodon hypophthalmus]